MIAPCFFAFQYLITTNYIQYARTKVDDSLVAAPPFDDKFWLELGVAHKNSASVDKNPAVRGDSHEIADELEYEARSPWSSDVEAIRRFFRRHHLLQLLP